MGIVKKCSSMMFENIPRFIIFTWTYVCPVFGEMLTTVFDCC